MNRFYINLLLVMFAATAIGCGEGFNSEQSSVDNIGDLNTDCQAGQTRDASGACVASDGNSGATTGNNNGTNGSDVTCPTGVSCVTRPWPIIRQEMISMRASEIMAIKISTTEPGLSGLLNTMYTTGNTATRVVSFSTVPGDFTGGGDASCVDQGLEVTSTGWQQEGVDKRTCQLPANSAVWINIKFTNCSPSSSCSFYLKSN